MASQTVGWLDYDLGERLMAELNVLVESSKRDQHVPLIIDAGANVGYSSAFFAERFPEAKILAIEPDPDAFALLTANTAGFANVVPVHAALWSHNLGVELSTAPEGSWAVSSHSGDGGRGRTPSLTLGDLAAVEPNSRVLLVKLDIEGAEREACAAGTDILREVPCIIVEPHDFLCPGRGSLTPLFEAVAGRQMDTLIRGENLVMIDSALAARA